MTPELFLNIAIKPAMLLLPAPMDSAAARALILGIALQESKLRDRLQIPRRPGGPSFAHGFLQFERGGGVVGVLTHPATKVIAARVCADLRYAATSAVVYRAMEHNDVLTCAFGRLLLWTLPGPLPLREDLPGGWKNYIDAWRPGEPRPDTWRFAYTQGWTVVDGRSNA